MLAHSRHRNQPQPTSIVRVGATTSSAPSMNKYLGIGVAGSIGLLLLKQPLPAAILLGSAMGASAMIDVSAPSPPGVL